MQFLDQEVQALADLAAFLDQPLDLVEVRFQAGQLLGDVDADGERGGLGQRPVLRGFGQRGAVREGHRFLPALEKPRTLLFHQLRYQRLGLPGQFAQLLQVAQEHARQAGALALARGHQFIDGLAGEF